MRGRERSLLTVLLAVVLLAGGVAQPRWTLGASRTTAAETEAAASSEADRLPENEAAEAADQTAAAKPSGAIIGLEDVVLKTEDDALIALVELSEVIGIEDVTAELGPCELYTMETETFYRFPQVWGDLPVYGRSITLRGEDGKCTAVSSDYTAIGELDPDPKLSEEDVRAIVTENCARELAVAPEGLTVYSLYGTVPTLAYQVRVAGPEVSEICFVDANEGRLLLAMPAPRAEELSGDKEAADTDGTKEQTEGQEAVTAGTEEQTEGQEAVIRNFRGVLEADLPQEARGREYLLSLQRSTGHVLAGSYEAGALSLALEDVFGELIEDYSDAGSAEETKDDKDAQEWGDSAAMDDSCDWIAEDRNMKEPTSATKGWWLWKTTKYPDHYKGKAYMADTRRDHGGIHTNNTVISHALYCMVHPEAGQTALTNDELWEILYRAQGFLPVDCSFGQFAAWLQVAAGTLAESKQQCVTWAMESVGITPGSIISGPERKQIADQRVRKNTVWSVTDEEGDLCDRYTVKIDGRRFPAPRDEVVKSDVREEKVTKQEALKLKLEPGYLYQLTFVDGRDETRTVERTVLVRNEKKEQKIKLKTKFKSPMPGRKLMEGTWILDSAKMNSVNSKPVHEIWGMDYDTVYDDVPGEMSFDLKGKVKYSFGKTSASGTYEAESQAVSFEGKEKVSGNESKKSGGYTLRDEDGAQYLVEERGGIRYYWIRKKDYDKGKGYQPDWKAAFKKIVDEMDKDFFHYLYDWDEDGIPELFTDAGYGSDRAYNVYRFSRRAGLTQKIGKIGSGSFVHVRLCGISEKGAILCHFTHMDSETVAKWTWKNGKFSEKVLYEKDYDYFANPDYEYLSLKNLKDYKKSDAGKWSWSGNPSENNAKLIEDRKKQDKKQEEEAKGYTDQELIDMAKKYRYATCGDSPNFIWFHQLQGDQVQIQMAYDMEDHIATVDRYFVSRKTAEGTNFQGEPIDLKQYS